MSHHHNRLVKFIFEATQEIKNSFCILSVKVACWFVCDQENRVNYKGSGNGNPLLFSARHLIWEMMLAFGQSDDLERGLYRFATL